MRMAQSDNAANLFCLFPGAAWRHLSLTQPRVQPAEIDLQQKRSCLQFANSNRAISPLFRPPVHLCLRHHVMAQPFAMMTLTTTNKPLTEFTLFPNLPIDLRKRIFGYIDTPYAETHIHAIRGFPEHILKDKARNPEQSKSQRLDYNTTISNLLTPCPQNSSSLPRQVNSSGPTPTTNGLTRLPSHTLYGTCKEVAFSPPLHLVFLPSSTSAMNHDNSSSRSTTSFPCSAHFSILIVIFCSLMLRLPFTMPKSIIPVSRFLQSCFVIRS